MPHFQHPYSRYFAHANPQLEHLPDCDPPFFNFRTTRPSCCLAVIYRADSLSFSLPVYNHTKGWLPQIRSSHRVSPKTSPGITAYATLRITEEFSLQDPPDVEAAVRGLLIILWSVQIRRCPPLFHEKANKTAVNPCPKSPTWTQKTHKKLNKMMCLPICQHNLAYCKGLYSCLALFCSAWTRHSDCCLFLPGTPSILHQRRTADTRWHTLPLMKIVSPFQGVLFLFTSANLWKLVFLCEPSWNSSLPPLSQRQLPF